MNNELRVRLLLALQASLLGYVSANMRVVSCGLTGNSITVKVVFDGEIGDHDVDAMDEVGSELASHFEHETVDVQCVRIDAPLPLSGNTLGLLAYKRRE